MMSLLPPAPAEPPTLSSARTLVNAVVVSDRGASKDPHDSSGKDASLTLFASEAPEPPPIPDEFDSRSDFRPGDRRVHKWTAGVDAGVDTPAVVYSDDDSIRTTTSSNDSGSGCESDCPHCAEGACVCGCEGGRHMSPFGLSIVFEVAEPVETWRNTVSSRSSEGSRAVTYPPEAVFLDQQPAIDVATGYIVPTSVPIENVLLPSPLEGHVTPNLFEVDRSPPEDEIITPSRGTTAEGDIVDRQLVTPGSPTSGYDADLSLPNPERSDTSSVGCNSLTGVLQTRIYPNGTSYESRDEAGEAFIDTSSTAFDESTSRNRSSSLVIEDYIPPDYESSICATPERGSIRTFHWESPRRPTSTAPLAEGFIEQEDSGEETLRVDYEDHSLHTGSTAVSHLPEVDLGELESDEDGAQQPKQATAPNGKCLRRRGASLHLREAAMQPSLGNLGAGSFGTRHRVPNLVSP